ncbi:GumC family protein [Scytonema sp. NUACC26]|uniref:GumC family protein n=1 Tax=Scytonema sp. NUACC26 TaxID=3140176 RepID=UPI0034DC317B
MEAQDSVLSFDTYWQILKRRRLAALGTFLTVFLAASLPSSVKKPEYEAEGKLLFERINKISSLTGVGTELNKLESVTQENSNPLITEAEVISSFPVIQKTIDKLQLRDKNGELLKHKDFLENFKIVDIEKTDILKISYKDTVPQRAARVVNALMATYLEYNVSHRRTEVVAARKFLEKQLPKAESVVRKAEVELAEFQQKNKVLSLREEATKGVEVITEIQKQNITAQSKLADVNSQIKEIRTRLGMNSQEALTVASLNQSSGVQDVLKEIQQLESQLAARRTVLQNSHPEIINLENKLTALQEILQQRTKQVAGTTTQIRQNGKLQTGELQQQLIAELVRLESSRQGLASEAASLSKLQASYQQRLQNMPKLEQQQRQLERKVEAAQSTYSLLLQKLQESRIAENQNIGNASNISPAQIPEEPTSSLMIWYVSAALLATIASIMSILLLEATDKSIKSVDEARELLGLTLLGVIPSFSKSKTSTRINEEYELGTCPLFVQDTPPSPVSEAFRMLRANLRYVSADKELKVIVVTSSVPKEGKSTVAANLAMAMAQKERKVLLIDADLHRPVQHFIWGLHNSQGLSNIIVGQAEIKTAINQVMDNLYVLTSGVIPPSPAALLDSKRMASLIDKLGVSYDFVIIDAPSLTVAADAANLGQMSDGVLLVVRPGMVDSVNVTLAKELLEKSGQKILGQVVNGVIPKNERYSYYFREEYYQEEIASQDETAKTNRNQIQMTNNK